MSDSRKTKHPCADCRKNKYCTKQCKKVRDYIFLEAFRYMDKKTGISKILGGV